MEMTAEQLIYDLQKQVIRLEEELKQANEYIEDFEKAAKTWKSSYRDMERKYKIELMNAKKVIEQLEKELSEP